MTLPVRAQYLRLKRPYPDALLLFRLGDFYECYDADARVAARALDLTVAARDFGEDTRVPMCAVPYHAVERQIEHLVARGYTVAIAEQIGGPRTAKGLVVREIVRVVSPASAADTRRCPAPRPVVGPSGIEPDSHDAPPVPRESDTSIIGTGTNASARPGSAIEPCETERATIDAVQLVLFDVPAGGDDSGR